MSIKRAAYIGYYYYYLLVGVGKMRMRKVKCEMTSAEKGVERWIKCGMRKGGLTLRLNSRVCDALM